MVKNATSDETLGFDQRIEVEAGTFSRLFMHIGEEKEFEGGLCVREGQKEQKDACKRRFRVNLRI